MAHNQLTGAPITLDMVDTALRDLLRNKEPKRVRIEDIQRIVSKHFNVSRADLLSSRRTRAIVRPRQIAMYLAKILTPRSLPEIGRRFGGRDHTTGSSRGAQDRRSDQDRYEPCAGSGYPASRGFRIEPELLSVARREPSRPPSTGLSKKKSRLLSRAALLF